MKLSDIKTGVLYAHSTSQGTGLATAFVLIDVTTKLRVVERNDGSRYKPLTEIELSLNKQGAYLAIQLPAEEFEAHAAAIAAVQVADIVDKPLRELETPGGVGQYLLVRPANIRSTYDDFEAGQRAFEAAQAASRERAVRERASMEARWAVLSAALRENGLSTDSFGADAIKYAANERVGISMDALAKLMGVELPKAVIE